MGIARSTYHDQPEKAADDTAIVEAVFALKPHVPLRSLEPTSKWSNV